MMNKLIVLLVVALCLVNTCSATYCYECDSIEEPKCADENLDKALMRQIDCYIPPYPLEIKENPIIRCYKRVIKDDTGERVRRGCYYYNSHPDEDGHEIVDLNKCQFHYICEGNLCNSAVDYTAMNFMALIGVYVMTFIL